MVVVVLVVVVIVVVVVTIPAEMIQKIGRVLEQCLQNGSRSISCSSSNCCCRYHPCRDDTEGTQEFSGFKAMLAKW